MRPSAAVRRHWAWWVGVAVVVVGVLVFAGGRTPDEGTGDGRLYALAGQLKCLQCVGESVAASQAPLAEQFRDEIRQQMATGATDDEILAFFVDRYGDEVLLEPPATGLSALVWVLPVLVVAGAVVGLGLAFGRWRSAPAGPQWEPVRAGRGLRRGPGAGRGCSAGRDGAGRGGAGSQLAGGAGGRGGGCVRGPGRLAGGQRIGRPWGGRADRGTGGIAADLARCQPLAMREPAAAIECYDDILATSPDNLEALTYRGGPTCGPTTRPPAWPTCSRRSIWTRTTPTRWVFLAVVASNNGAFTTAAEELAAFWANDPSEAAVAVVQAEGLDRKVFFGVMSPATRTCWQQAARGGGEGAIDQAFLDELGACLDGVLAAAPEDPDARLSRALAHVGPERSDPAAARLLLEGLLSEDADDADALALLTSLDIAAQDLESAGRRLDRLEDLPRGPAAFLIGDAATLRAAYAAAREASLPNPDGG